MSTARTRLVYILCNEFKAQKNLDSLQFFPPRPDILFQDGTTPLILAAAGGHADAVAELLEQGADPAAKRLVSLKKFYLLYNFAKSDI